MVEGIARDGACFSKEGAAVVVGVGVGVGCAEDAVEIAGEGW